MNSKLGYARASKSRAYKMRRWKTCKQELWGNYTLEPAESVFNLLQWNYGVLTFIQQPVTRPKGGLLSSFRPGGWSCTSCGIIGAYARPNWQERQPRKSLTRRQWSGP